ncbi:MAG TPA: DinB family protein [Thermoanaerobaculia bacterium]|nr:DinB family protein [Thermoanaerobaculia bacterium]
MANVGHPEPAEYAPFYAGYVGNVTEDDVVGALERQAAETAALLARIDEEKASYRYAPEKWSVKEVVGHFTDGEVVFAYRALAIARGDQSSLPGFDENDYMRNSNFDQRPMRDIAAAYSAARASTVALFRGFSDEAWQRRGTANKAGVSVRALAHIVLGHERHHLRVLRERYGVV